MFCGKTESAIRWNGMHLTTRRIVFYSLVAVFFLGAAYALLTAFGLSVDLKEGLTRTGSIFVAGAPRDATLFLDGAPAEESRGIISGGTLVRNLLPGNYEVRFEREGRAPWRAELPVISGLVTRATDLFLWPLEASASPVVADVELFSLSAGAPLVKNSSGTLMLGDRAIPGNEVVYATNDSGLTLTRSGNTIYLTETARARSVTNVTALFQSLKERELGLPGAVPIVNARPHPFSQGKLIITTKTSLYLLDLRRISLERLVTVSAIAASAFTGDEVFLAGADGTLTAVDLVFKTTRTAPFTSSAVAALAIGAGGDMVIWKTPEGTLFSYDRVTGDTVSVADNAGEFSVSPDGLRLAAVERNAVAIIALAPYTADAFVARGYRTPVWEGSSTPKKISWNPTLPRYLFFLADNRLIVAEIGFYGERNSYALAENVMDFALAGYTAYVLKTDGALITLSLE
ncbi:MAG: hypothetical protein HYU81_03080 [Candidatus Brennerbacteria bacterium]|nr:hypothetical protein [Candidatus Brennerbacteria bacterium]